MGIPVGLGVRFQINVMIRKASLVGDYLRAFPDDLILPCMWFSTVRLQLVHGRLATIAHFTL